MSDSYDFPSGQYPYPLTKVLTDGGDFSKEFIPGDPTNVVPDVDNFYVICCTPDQMSKIQSSIEVGAPIAFPDLYSDVFQVVDQATQFPNSFEGSPCVDLCALILQCIEENEDIQQAIAGLAGTSNINGESTQNTDNLSSQLVNNPTGCDDDIIFGMTMQLVEFADRLIKDLFEQIAAANLASVNVGYLIKLIPVIETLPFDEAFQFADKLVNDMETAYLSASVALLKEEIACELFCLAKDNDCVLTLEMVRDYFQEKAEITFDYDDVFSFIVDFINGTFVGNAVYYGMNILFFQIFVFAGKFMEYFYDDYLRTIQSMYNDPNSDWSTLCDECVLTNTVVVTFDEEGYQEYTNLEGIISESIGDPAPSADGVYNAGISTMRAVTRVDLLAEHTILEVGMYSFVSVTNWTALIQLRDESETLIESYLETGNTQINTWKFNGTSGLSVEGIRYIDFYTALGSPSVEIYQDNLLVRYEI